MVHDLVLQPSGKFGSKGERYDVLFNGDVIASGWSPEYAACRELQDD